MTGKNTTRQRIALTVLLAALVVLLFGIAGCDDRLARMEENQIRLQAMVAANARQLATVSSQIHTGTGEVQEGLRALDQNDRNLAAEVTAVQNEQASLHSTVRNNRQAIDGRMATLDENQRLLQDGVTQVAGVAQRTASNVTAIAKEHATLHQMVQTAREELGGSLAVVTGNQQNIRTDIGRLQQADERIAAQLVAMAASQDRIYNGLDGLHTFMQAVAKDITCLSTGQTALHQSLHEHDVALADKSAILERDIRTVRSEVGDVAGVARSNADGVTSLAADQAALRQTLDANHRIVAGQVAAVIENQQTLQEGLSNSHETLRTGFDRLGAGTGDIAANLTAVKDEQNALRETVKTGNETLAVGLSDVANNQVRLRAGIDAKADAIGAELTSIAQRQTSLSQDLKTASDALVIQATVMAESRQTMTAGLEELREGTQRISKNLSTVAGTANRTASDIAALRDNHATLRQSIQDGMGSLNDRTGGLAAQLDSLAQRQTTLQQQVQAGNEALVERTTALGSSQDTLQAQLDSLTATTGQSALDILGLHDSQNLLQQAIHAGVNDLAARTDRVSADVAEVAAGQTSLRDAISTGHEALSTRVATVVDGQKALRADIGRVDQRTEEVTANLTQVASAQKAFDQTLKSHTETINGHAAKLADNQAGLQTGLDTITATAGQTALDVLDVAARQNAIAQSQQSRGEAVASQMADLARGQQQMHSNTDALMATTGQATLDILALGDNQSRLTRALQADRQELAARLAGIAEGQQQWSQRLDAAQTNVQTLAASVSTIEQRIATLQGSLQDSLDGLTILLGDDGQKRVQFEARMNQDIQAAADALAQLNRIQATLKEQIQQIQNATQSQTDNILSAIGQLKQPPVDVRISSTGTTLEPSVVEAAAK